MPPLRSSPAEVDAARQRRQWTNRIRRANVPAARRIRRIERGVAATPRFHIGQVSSTSPFKVTVRPGQEGSWVLDTPARMTNYSPVTDDWVLILDMGKSPLLDPGSGGRVVLGKLQLG